MKDRSGPGASGITPAEGTSPFPATWIAPRAEVVAPVSDSHADRALWPFREPLLAAGPMLPSATRIHIPTCDFGLIRNLHRPSDVQRCTPFGSTRRIGPTSAGFDGSGTSGRAASETATAVIAPGILAPMLGRTDISWWVATILVAAVLLGLFLSWVVAVTMFIRAVVLGIAALIRHITYRGRHR